MASIEQWGKTVTPKDKRFYQNLGQRIAKFRKAQNLTQQQLADILGVAQQTLAHYEGGRLRVAVISIPTLARALNTTVEELIDEPITTTKKKRGPASTLQRQIEQIGLMPRSKQKFITEMLEALIKQQQSA